MRYATWLYMPESSLSTALARVAHAPKLAPSGLRLTGVATRKVPADADLSRWLWFRRGCAQGMFRRARERAKPNIRTLSTTGSLSLPPPTARLRYRYPDATRATPN